MNAKIIEGWLINQIRELESTAQIADKFLEKVEVYVTEMPQPKVDTLKSAFLQVGRRYSSIKEIVKKRFA